MSGLRSAEGRSEAAGGTTKLPSSLLTQTPIDHHAKLHNLALKYPAD
jgi:hypothetical protein